MEPTKTYSWDIFISHAGEDGETVAEPLASVLADSGLTVWIDRQQLKVGDSLRRNIDEGLSKARFGVVILSKNYFAKEWAKKELDALFSKEYEGKKVILPIWHEVTRADVAAFSPMLADKYALSTSVGFYKLAEEINFSVTGVSGVTARGIKDQIALLSFIDDLIKEENDPKIKPEHLPNIRLALLNEVNQMINVRLVAILPESDQRELDVLLKQKCSDWQLDLFFKRKIPNLQAELASVLLDFKAAYLYDPTSGGHDA